MVKAPFTKEVIGSDGTLVPPEAVVGEHDGEGLKTPNPFQKKADQGIKFAVAAPYFFDSAVGVRNIRTGFFDVVPKFVLDPVRLLEVDHAHVPFVFLQNKGCELKSLLETTYEFADELVELLVRFGRQEIPQREIQSRTVVLNLFKNPGAKFFWIGKTCVCRRGVPTGYHHSIHCARGIGVG